MPLGAKKIQNLRAEVKGVGSTFMVRGSLRLLRCSVICLTFKVQCKVRSISYSVILLY